MSGFRIRLIFLVLRSISKDETPRSDFQNIRQGTGGLGALPIKHVLQGNAGIRVRPAEDRLLITGRKLRILDKMVDKTPTLRVYLQALGL